MSKFAGKKKKGASKKLPPSLAMESQLMQAQASVDNLGSELVRMKEPVLDEADEEFTNATKTSQANLFKETMKSKGPVKDAKVAVKRLPMAGSSGTAQNNKPTLGRNKFFDQFSVNDYYPLDKLQKVKQLIEAEPGDTHLHLPGIEQLSDLVFYALFILKEKKPYTNVKCLNITGCLNITDLGLKYAAKAFPGLEELCVKGCDKVTEAGLYQVVIRCPGLTKVRILGTNVAILPRQVVDMDICVEGYPCISPEKDVLEKQGLKIMKASLFQKPADKDLVKLCVIQSSDSTTSFVRYLKKDKEKPFRPISTLSQFALTSRFTTNVVECDEVLCDLFITRRALYVLTVSPKETQKDGCKRIFALICHILNKVQHAAFVLVSFKSGAETTALDAVKNAVAASASNKSSALRKSLKEEAQKTMKAGHVSSKQEQEMYMRKLMLSKALKKLSVECVEVDSSQLFKQGDALCTCLAAGMERVCQLYPEMQELAGPMFKFVQSDSSLRTLKDGVVSISGSKPTVCKTMELLEVMGRTVCLPIIQEARTVCQVDWLARVLNQAFTVPGGMRNLNRVLGVASDTPMWLLEDLKKELEKVLPQEQANTGTMLLVKLGLSVNPSVFISYKDLPDVPTPSLETFFPEIPPTEMKKDLFFTVGYKAELETPLPSLIIHRMMSLCSRTKRPSIMWKNGFVLLDGCVETLFLLEPADSTAIYIYSHTVKKDQGAVEESLLVDMVWNTFLPYKVVFDYVLKERNVPYLHTFVSGTQSKQEVTAYGLVGRHQFKEILDENDTPTGGCVCSVCNESPKNAALSWVLHGSLDKPYMPKYMFDILGDGGVYHVGNALTFTNQGGVSLRSLLSPGNQTDFKVGLLTADALKLRIGLGYGYVPKKGYCSGGFFLDLSTGIISDMMSKKQLGTIPKENLPKLGNAVTLQCCSKEKPSKDIDLKVFRDTEQVASLTMPQKDYVPVIQSPAADKDYKATVVVHPLYTMEDKEITDLQPGMRLEALDRKNPHLICVATIQEIMDNGKLVIHFDGWTSQYDYISDPKSSDLHPVGWMEKNKNTSYNSQLQAPHRYGKPFTWEQYCEENSFHPVPWGWFTLDQIGPATRDRYDSVLQDLDISQLQGDFSTSCKLLKHRPKMVEQRTLIKCLANKDVFDFFSKHNKFFCLLPESLNLQTLRNPSLQSIMDFSKQHVHILCPGIKTELLHLVDYKGTPMPSNFSISDIASYLQSCYIGLLMQEGVLPRDCHNLIPGLETVTDSGQFELSAQRIFFHYVFILELHVEASKTKGNRVAMDLFAAVAKDKDAAALFSEKEPSPLCKGHAGSFMANNELREIPLSQFSQFFHFMSKLDFQNNILETLPEDFFVKFKHLESLNLANNRLETLPDGINNLKELIQLDLSGNKICLLPQGFDGLKNSLVSLNISDNPLNGLPVVVFELLSLEELLAENVGTISNLSEITKLTKLEVLNLGKNSIENIPDGLGDLPLTSLDLSGVPWFPSSGQFQSFRAFMHALKVNNVTAAMSEKQMHELFVKSDADESSSLTPNEILDLNYNTLFPKYPRLGAGKQGFEKTGGFPTFIFRLTKLKRLVLRHHGLTSVPDEIKSLTELAEIDLSFNPKLLTVSAELGGCPVKQIQLQECIVLNTPPKEIVTRGVVSIMGYLKRLKLGASPCKRTKLMLVGLGGAGKTSLVSSLINAKYRAYMNYDEPITDGIDITKWEIPIDKAKNDTLTFSVWDFAGQTVYYNTHQFFLSNRGVYLLLWNVRQGSEHAGLDFWLSSIACHAPKAPILVIGTHVDKVEKFHLPEQDLKNRYPQIAGFYYVSCYTGSGISDLKESLIKLTLQQKYMGERIPEAWLTLEKRLIAHREDKKVDIMPYKQLDTISGGCGIFDRTELIQAVQFLHDLGAVQFFNKDFLRDMVVIYPQWIVDVMACLVTVHEGAVKDGRLNLRDIGTVWQAYPKDLHPWLLRLTEEFDLTCPLREEEVCIVPCLLPDKEPTYDWPHADPQKNIHESMTVYRFQYLPAGLFNRAQVRMHHYSKGSLLWKKGSYMKKNGHICLMLQTKDQEVVVRAQGFRPDNFLFLVHEMIETLITESYTGVQYDFLIPCMDCLSMNVKDPSMVSHYKVQRALELNVPFLQCKKFFHILSIQELRDAMPSDKMSDMDNHLQNSVRELIDLTQEATISVFFVFTGKNQPSLSDGDDVVHPGTVLEDLRKQENFKVSYTDKPQTSDMEALSLSMKSANVTMIGMSDEFCQDAECKKLLLYVKDVLRRPVLLLLLGKTKNWQKTDINMSIGTEVYVDMTNKGRYQHKIKELYDALKKKAAVKSKIKDDSIPKCFISYCWTNSHDAISKGSRPQDGGLGWDDGDPRKVKVFLEEKGVKCWIDVERVGGVGLFHSIADGLREAEVMIAFVSDQYVKSRNCVMEFRYALSTLRIPVILVVVGTGYEWERSEVGLLAVGHKCPKVSLQYENPTGYLDLLKFVQEKITKEEEDSKLTKESAENQRNIAFQEVLELTQRKFLRHMYTTIINESSEPYPGLIVVDFLRGKEKQEISRKRNEAIQREKTMIAEQKTVKDGAGDGKPEEKKEKAETAASNQEAAGEEETKSNYCFRVLCENPEGWHVTESFITFPEMDPSDEQLVIDNAAPYLGRVYAIARHSNIQLECLTTPEGEIFQQRVEEIGVKSASDFKEEYKELRGMAIGQDKGGTKHSLHRCIVNGKMVWLCGSHKMASRSQTEMRYGNQLSAGTESIPLPTDAPEDLVPEPPPEEVQAPQTMKSHRKVFKRSSSQKPQQLKRQTSQACHVM